MQQDHVHRKSTTERTEKIKQSKNKNQVAAMTQNPDCNAVAGQHFEEVWAKIPPH